ncbi:MAG TPA: hypothetical protein VNL96_04185 [Gemmatimonadaceae bacterium]|nr:hypothetical protein [Gemmatimonadaceae bacterium]
MRVGIDLFSLVPKLARGAGYRRYARGLVTALDKLDDGNTYVMFLNPLNAEMFVGAQRLARSPTITRGRGARPSYLNGLIPVASTSQSHSVGWRRWFRP